MSPLVSICIPMYKGEKYLRECLDSVLAQTYAELEILIVDDVSSDGSAGIVEEYMKRDKRIILYRNAKNLGLVGNWNKCLELAKGEWIKFVFQDDLIAPECVEKMLKAVGGHSMVVSERKFIFDNFVTEQVKDYYSKHLVSLKTLVSPSSPAWLNAEKISNMTMANLSLNFIGEPTAVMFKKSVALRIGSFNEDLTQICDLEYWLRIAIMDGLVYIPEELVSFRIHADSTTSVNVLSKPKFQPRYIDTLILAHELLCARLYVGFRRNISKWQKNKLAYYLKTRMLEARNAFEKDQSIDRNFFEELIKKYPDMDAFYKVSPGVKLVHSLLLLRRKMRKK